MDGPVAGLFLCLKGNRRDEQGLRIELVCSKKHSMTCGANDKSYGERETQLIR